jgi:hypothetical protein
LKNEKTEKNITKSQENVDDQDEIIDYFSIEYFQKCWRYG